MTRQLTSRERAYLAELAHVADGIIGTCCDMLRDGEPSYCGLTMLCNRTEQVAQMATKLNGVWMARWAKAQDDEDELSAGRAG